MQKKALLKFKLPLWQRIAAFFSFVALASALLAPSALLAEEVRTGKLAGLCGISSSSYDNQAESDEAPAQAHCEACSASPGMLFEHRQPIVLVAAEQTAAKADLPSDLPTRIDGLPPSRGPPAL